MHLVIAFATPPLDSARTAWQSMNTPALDRLLSQWAETRIDEGDESTLSPPHERALAAAYGWPAAPDGCLPWAAHLAAADGVTVGTQPWGLLTPAHWRVGSDGVHMADPGTLALSAAESRTLFAAVQPLFAGEGYTLAWGSALRWYAAHTSLQNLATASLDRVIGRNIGAWLPRQPEAKPLRRLQNEVQMLLHDHALNEAREARGALPVNSFWLSGCGTAQAARGDGVRVEERLRSAALQGNAAWQRQWQAIDAEMIAPLLAGAARGEPQRLTLCGDRSSIELAPQRRAWWQRVGDRLRPASGNARTRLEAL
jgi:hypothetical protein